MIANIYKVGPLNYLKIFQCDNGSEFKGEVTKLLPKHEVPIRQVMTKYKHTHTVFLEAFSKVLTERLFKVQDVQELNDPERVLSTWVEHPYGSVDQLDDTKIQITGMSPSEVIKLKKVPPVERYLLEDTLLKDGLYCYLLQPGEEHNDQQCRATDTIWSKETYRLREDVSESGNWVMYYLSDGPKRAFVLKESMFIPEDTELPLDYIQKW